MQELLDHIHNDLIVRNIPGAGNIPIHFVYIGGLLAASVVIILWMSLVAMGWIWGERKVAGFIQHRVGPNRVGKWGILQSIADGIKLLTKEDIIPTKADRILYELAPLLVFAGAFIPFVALPFSQHLVIADMDLGLFYVLAFGALEVVGILMAGWGPNSKWSLYGGMRLAAQMLSYEIPLGLSVLVVVLLAGTLNLTDMVIWQTQGVLIWDSVNTPWILDWLNWAIFRSPWAALPAFLIFFVAGLAETKRAPFDLPEAESELVAGFHTEYTGIRFSYFFLAEYCAMYVISVLGVIVFLGGWHWPLPCAYDVGDANVITRIAAGEGVFHVMTEPQTVKVILNELAGLVNLVGKSFVLMFIMLWIRWTLPRVRIDQVMHMCLKVLLPLGLVCLVLAAFQAVVTINPQTDLRASAVVGKSVPTGNAGILPASSEINAKAEPNSTASGEEEKAE